MSVLLGGSPAIAQSRVPQELESQALVPDCLVRSDSPNRMDEWRTRFNNLLASVKLNGVDDRSTRTELLRLAVVYADRLTPVPDRATGVARHCLLEKLKWEVLSVSTPWTLVQDLDFVSQRSTVLFSMDRSLRESIGARYNDESVKLVLTSDEMQRLQQSATRAMISLRELEIGEPLPPSRQREVELSIADTISHLFPGGGK